MLVFGLMAVGALLEMLGVVMFVPLLNALTGGNAGSALAKVGIELPRFETGDVRVLVGYAAILALAYFVKNFFILGVNYLQFRLVQDETASTARNLLRDYLAMDYVRLIERNPAEIIRNVETTTSAVFEGGLLGLLMVAMECLVIIGLLGILLVADPLTTLVTGVVLGTGLLAYYAIIHGPAHRWGKLFHAASAETVKWVNQAMGAVKEAKVLGREEFFVGRYGKSAFERARYRAFMATAGQSPRLFFEFLIILGVVLVTLFALLRSDDIATVVSTLGLFVIVAFRLMPSFNRVAANLAMMRSGVKPLNDLYDDIAAARAARASRASPTDTASIHFGDSITFENVGFAYPERDYPAIHGINLSIRPGQSIGIVGPSGAGKSTLIDILLGIHRPQEGHLKADGADVHQNLRDWQNLLGYVPQTNYLLDDSLRNNIAFAVESSAIDESRIELAVQRAQLGPFVESLPHGLDTRLGDRGVALSGGQRQRVAIARALYGEPRLLVLDEATASLDGETEAAIFDALEMLSGKITVVIISHHLNVVRDCNLIALMENGTIVATGTFDELAEGNELFGRQLGRSRPSGANSALPASHA